MDDSKKTNSNGVNVVENHDALRFNIDRISNVAGDVEIWLTVRNVSKQSTFVNPSDFTISNDSGNVTNTDLSTVETFKGTELQSGQSVYGMLDFKQISAQFYHTLNYNGNSGSQQITIAIPEPKGIN